MKNSFYALCYRMRYINRWGLMRCDIPETLTEHCADTAILAHALGMIGNRYFGKEYDLNRIATLALFHDLCEVYTGDMPTPVKYGSEEMRKTYKQIEKLSTEKLLSKLPEEFVPEYKAILCPENEDEEYEKIVKAADKLSAYLKCLEEMRSGNPEFRTACESIRKSIDENPLPELKYFTEHFLSSFDGTLDEM